MTLDAAACEPKRSIATAGMGFLGFCLTAILFLTLKPVPERWSEKSFALCILCDVNTIPNALGNVLLFLPLGVALAFRSYRALPSVLFGVFVSLGIEMTQFVIPGRYQSLQDIVFNVLGTFLGFRIARSSLGWSLADALGWCRNVWEQWKRPHPALANRLMCGAVLISTAVFGLTGWLLAPTFPDGPYLFAGKEMDGGITPLRIGANGDRIEYFQGTIDEVRIYDRALAPEEIQADMERPVGAVSLRSSPCAAYGFDEGSGDRILDASGQGNHGLLDGAVRAAGRFGRALVFDGHHDQVIIPYAPVLDLGTSFTLEAWIRPEVSPNPWPAVIHKQGDHYFLYAGAYMASLVPNAGGTFGGASESVAAPEPLAPGVWSHLAASYDGSGLRMYINGHLVASFVRWFQGRIDEMSVGSTEVRPGFVDTRWVRRALETGETLRLRGIVGPAMNDKGALLDIQNRRHDHILMLAAHGDDLVLSYLTVASALGLPSPETRFRGALQGIAPGSPFDVELSGTPTERFLTVNGETHRELGFSLGMGWSTLIYFEYLPRWLREALNLTWMAGWMFPVGFWSQTRLAFLGAVLFLGSGILILPAMSVLVPSPPAQWAAAALGLLVGISIRLKNQGGHRLGLSVFKGWLTST